MPSGVVQSSDDNGLSRSSLAASFSQSARVFFGKSAMTDYLRIIPSESEPPSPWLSDPTEPIAGVVVGWRHTHFGRTSPREIQTNAASLVPRPGGARLTLPAPSYPASRPVRLDPERRRAARQRRGLARGVRTRPRTRLASPCRHGGRVLALVGRPADRPAHAARSEPPFPR